MGNNLWEQKKVVLSTDQPHLIQRFSTNRKEKSEKLVRQKHSALSRVYFRWSKSEWLVDRLDMAAEIREEGQSSSQSTMEQELKDKNKKLTMFVVLACSNRKALGKTERLIDS